MKSIIKQNNRKAAFTIVELLTVMSIIVILIGLLVPALNRVRIYASTVKQYAQFHSIEAAIELFNNEFDGYPESSGLDPKGQPYCGAMKLCEAMMGLDLLGFHSNSIFDRDGEDKLGNLLYTTTDLSARKGPFLPPESADVFKMEDIYEPVVHVTDQGFLDTSLVLCDVYTRRLENGKKIGMPILYFKANTRARFHDPSKLGADEREPTDNIYNYWDNRRLVMLGKPDAQASEHKFEVQGPERFYRNTEHFQIQETTANDMPRPFRADSYILMSAGYDGDYGTADDIYNFDWRYRD